MQKCQAFPDHLVHNTCIGGVAEAAAAEENFCRHGVKVSLTVTPCWCYGSETMDMNPHRPKAVWGFNGTERPGAVYLAAVLAGHAQKGLPAFGIYGCDQQHAKLVGTNGLLRRVCDDGVAGSPFYSPVFLQSEDSTICKWPTFEVTWPSIAIP